LAKDIDHQPLDKATEARVNVGLHMFLEISEKHNNSLAWGSKLRNCALNKTDLGELAQELNGLGIAVFSLPMAGVAGTVGINGSDLPAGYENFYPINPEQKLPYLKRNNYHKTDVGDYAVDNMGDNIKMIQQSQQEVGIGNLTHIGQCLQDPRPSPPSRVAPKNVPPSSNKDWCTCICMYTGTTNL
jgi:hypothetical protein